MDLNKPGSGRKLIGAVNLYPIMKTTNTVKSKNAEIFKKAGGKPVKPNGR
jgi:hypothetical protein